MGTSVPISYLDILGASQVLRPYGITTDESLNIYVAEAAGNQITKLDEQGKLLMSFGRGEGGLFKKVGKLAQPAGIAVDAAGNSYVADFKQSCIFKFNAQGQFIMSFGKRGKGDGEFNHCWSARFDSEGGLWVKTDVTQAAQVESMLRETMDTYGRLDYAFNNAGSGGIGGLAAEMDEKDDDSSSAHRAAW